MDLERSTTRSSGQDGVPRGLTLLRREKLDEVWRDRAALSASDLAAYLTHVRTRTERFLGWRYRRRMATVEIADDVIERVLVAFHHNDWRVYETSCRPAFWQVRDKAIAESRKNQRRRKRLVDAPGEQFHALIERPDEAFSREEIRHRWPSPLAETLAPHLTKTQRRTLSALLVEIDEGPIRGIVTRVACRLGRNKAQAARSIQRIRKLALARGALELFEVE
jgi:hypothetical protein